MQLMKNLTILFHILGTNNINRVCLPVHGLNAQRIAGGRPAIVAGWGMTEKSDSSDILMHTRVNFRDVRICKKKYPKNFNGKSQLCLLGENGQDSCSGDSGGPLVLSGPSSPPYLLIGITSYGPVPCGQKYSPAVYTSVSRYVNWINKHIK